MKTDTKKALANISLRESRRQESVRFQMPGGPTDAFYAVPAGRLSEEAREAPPVDEDRARVQAARRARKAAQKGTETPQARRRRRRGRV